MTHPTLNKTLAIGRRLGFRLALVPLICAGCRQPTATQDVKPVVLGSPIEAVDLSIPSRVEVATEPVRLRAVRAGWADVVLRVLPAGASGRPTLRLPAFARTPSPTAAVSAVNVYQVVSTPVDFGTAAYVRQSGERGTVRSVPRVLVPLPVGAGGTVDLVAAGSRDPKSPLLVWVEVRAGDHAPAGESAAACDLLDGVNGPVLGSVPVTLSVADLSLADPGKAGVEPLRITADLDWARLAASDPAPFAGVTPRLLSRAGNPAAVAAIDSYQRLAHEHAAAVAVDRVQPIVKWPPGQPPVVDWTDYDGVVGPWLDGSAFADRRPIGYWPVPTPDGLDDFDLTARCQYRAAVADHFDARRWAAAGGGAPANVCPVVLRSDAAGPVTDAAALLLSTEARATIDAVSTLPVLVPARDDQLPTASHDTPGLLTPAGGGRLLTRAVGGVDVEGRAAWPDRSPGPSRYLDLTEASVLHGTGDEQDIRAVAWLAHLRGATVLTGGRVLPSASSASAPAPADELAWCYPGAWYGVAGPVPTIQLKWLRQAATDYALLKLAAAAGDGEAATAMARLVAKPVTVGRSAAPSPQVALLGGITEFHACDHTRALLVDRVVALRGGGRKGAVSQLDLESVRWFDAHQRPTAFATAVRWSWAPPGPDLQGRVTEVPNTGPGSWITARVNVDVYDPAVPQVIESAANGTGDGAGDGPVTWSGNTLQWRTAGDGWEPRPPRSYVPVIPACRVRSVPAVVRYDLSRAGPAAAPTSEDADADVAPLGLSLVDGASPSAVDCPLVLPVATSERLARPVTLDGNLDEWQPTDAAWLDRPLVRMSSRPAVQAGDARRAEHRTSLYTGWTDEDLTVAFQVGGVRNAGVRTRTFTEYRDGRAWGEDLCELTVQPVYVDDTVGPTLHVVCKTGSESTERQSAGAAASGGQGGNWQPFEGTALRYAAAVDGPTGTWRGELSIPWSAIAAQGRGRPSLLRFNFSQHVHATGESATWAGPVDRSRQTEMAGLLVLRGAEGN